MRHIFDMLDTFNVQKEISDTDHVVAQLDHQREQRRRLHKKRIRPNDNLTLAERILKQRQLLGSGSEVCVVAMSDVSNRIPNVHSYISRSCNTPISLLG